MKKAAKLLALLLACVMVFSLTACGGGAASSAEAPAESSTEGGGETKEPVDIRSAIMIPGTLSDNPIFQMFVTGAQDAAKELGCPEPKVVEGGDDWDAYAKNMVSLSESGLYNLIITYTESMCESVLECGQNYPDIKYILLNGSLGEYTDKIPSNVYAVRIKNEDLGFLGGYFCGLVTTSTELKNANPDKKVGILFADVYDPWETQTKPAFKCGAHAVDPEIEVIDSVVGSWVDAIKGAEVARAQYAQGVDIIWYTTGSSTYGAVNEAQAEGKYAVPSDNNSISNDPNVIIGITTIEGYDYAKMTFLGTADGTLEYGTYKSIGAAEGVVSCTFDDPNYKQNVPQDIQDAMKEIYDKLAKGEIDPYQDA